MHLRLNLKVFCCSYLCELNLCGCSLLVIQNLLIQTTRQSQKLPANSRPLWSRHPPYPVAGVLPRSGTRWKPFLAQVDLGSAVRTGSLLGGPAALSRLESAFHRTNSAELTPRPSSDFPSASRLHPNGIRALCIWHGVVPEAASVQLRSKLVNRDMTGLLSASALALSCSSAWA